MPSKLIAASATALLLGFSAPSFAQSFTLHATDVPSDQVDRIQAHCDALAASEAGSDADSGSETEGGAASSTAGASTDAGAAAGAATDAAVASGGVVAAAGASTAAATDMGTDAAAATATGAASGADIDFATLDLATIEIDACRQGGFLAADGGAAAQTSTDAGATKTSTN